MNALFKALADPTRRQIIEMLRKRDMTAGEIADHFSISKPSISHHLDLLKQAQVVATIKEGQFIRYSLNTTVFDDMVHWVIAMADGKKPKRNKNENTKK